MVVPVAATAFSFLILAIVIAVCVWLPAEIAKRKGRNLWVWALLGLLFSVIALIVIAVLPSRKPTASPEPVDPIADAARSKPKP